MLTEVTKVQHPLTAVTEKSFGLKLPIFIQIQLISLFMTVSLAVLGFTVLNIIDTMKQTTNQRMARDNSLFENVINSRNKFQEIQNQYLLAILGQSTRPTEYNLQATIDMLGVLKVINEAEVTKVSQQLEAFKEVIRFPPSNDGYNKLTELSIKYNAVLNDIQRKISESSNAIVANNEEYSTNAKVIVFAILSFSCAVSLFLGFLISLPLSRSLKQIGKATKALAIGDLTQKVAVKGCPEVKEVATELNNAVNGLKRLVLAIANQSRQIVNSSNFFRALSLDTERTALQIAGAMEDLAHSSSEQSNQTELVMRNIHNLVKLVERVDHEIQSISSASEQVAKSAQLGQNSTEIVTTTFQDLSETTLETATVIDDLTSASQEIAEIVSLMDTVAEQTFLLSVNASIEAARAGKYGKGFGFVATETGKLAEQSKVAAHRIAELIEQMNQRTENVVLVMQKGKKRIEDGQQSVLTANNNFKNIFRSIMDNITQINAVASSASKMAEQSITSIEAVTSIAAIAEENLASVQEISATSEEQSTVMGKVSKSADDLTNISEKLNASIAEFQL